MDTRSSVNRSGELEELLDQQEARPLPPVPPPELAQSTLDSWATGAKSGADAAPGDGIASCDPGVPGHGGKWR